MRICMILAGIDFPPDVRVANEARALVKGGHQVSIICDLLKERAFEDDWEDCRIRRIPPVSSLLPKRVFLLKKSITFHDKHWAQQMGEWIEGHGADILHVHDLPMLGTALAVGKRYGLPVVADLHENYPAALKCYQPPRLTIKQRIRSIVDSPARWEDYELRCARNAEAVLVVVEEAKERLKRAGIKEEKIEVIENTPDIGLFSGFPLDETLTEKYKGDFIISYIGKFGGTHRGLDTAIKAMPGILKHIPHAKLLLVGKGVIKPVLERMVTDLSLGSRVEFLDWQPFEKMPTYIELSSVCLVPHRSNPHTDATSPHKLFQSMLMARPVVVSSCKPLKRVVEETGSGLVFEAGNPEDLVRTIVKLRDDGLRRELGEAGRRAVISKYNWEKTSEQLLAIYASLNAKMGHRRSYEKE